MENGKLGCQNSKTPKWNDIKFDMGDYVSNITLQAKIQSNHPMGELWQIGETLFSRDF